MMVIELYLGPHQYTVTCVPRVNNIFRNHSSSLAKRNVFFAKHFVNFKIISTMLNYMQVHKEFIIKF